MVKKKTPTGSYLIRYDRNGYGGFINIKAKSLADVKKYAKLKKVKILSAKKNYK